MDPITRLKNDFPAKADWIDQQYAADFGPGSIEPPDDLGMGAANARAFDAAHTFYRERITL